MLPVLISGAGIGGVALARGLLRVGIPCRVFERAPELCEVGAGVALSLNGVYALRHLGAGDGIPASAVPIRVGEMSSWRGASLGRLDIAELVPGAEALHYVLHRADLHRALAADLPPGVVTTGAEAAAFDDSGDEVRLTFKDGRSETGSLLVGADGIHSVVRRQLHGQEPLRYSGQTCYRGIAEMSPPMPGLLREVQGPGRRAGICPIDAGRVYWWAAINAPAAAADDPLRRRGDLLRDFDGWPFDLPEMIRRTPADGILRNDLVDRGPSPRWGRDRVTLLGDAAHPMLPNLGQGACTALEDAVVLSRSLATAANVVAALRSYEAERHDRTAKLIAGSWAFGVPVRWRNPVAVRAREVVLRMMPAALLRRQVRFYTDFDVGPLPDPVAA